MKILYIEDEYPKYSVFYQSLRKDHEVDWGYTVKSALDYINGAKDYDIAIVDILFYTNEKDKELLNKNECTTSNFQLGFTFAEKIKQRCPKVKIICLSNQTLKELVYPFDLYFKKPTHHDIIFNAIKDLQH